MFPRFTPKYCVCPEIDKEPIRVLKSSNGNWKPGMKNGVPVEMEQEVSVAFILSTKREYIGKAKQYLMAGNKSMDVKKQSAKSPEIL